MTPREELVSKWKNKGQTVSTVPVTDVLSPVQDLTKYNRIPVELANKLSIQKTLPTPSFAQKEIQPPKTSFKVKTTTPTVTTKTTGSVLRGAGQTAKEGGSLFVDVLRAVPEIRGQIESPGGKAGIYSALGALETSVGQVVKTVAEQKSLVPQPEGIMRKTVQNGLRELSDRLMSAGEEDFKTGEMLAESLPKFSFETKNERHKAIAAGIVQNAPNLLGGLLVGGGTALVTKNPSATTATLLAYTSALEGGFAYREAKQLGADDAQARKMMVRVGIANGILETLPISRFLNRSMATRNVKKQILSNVAKSIAQAGFEEGTTEGLQEMVLNFAMQEVDKNRDLFQGVPESAFFGAILGGGIAGGKAAYDKAKEETGGKLRLGMSIEDVSTPEDKGKLLSVHNLSEQKLRFAERVGGLANPSLAVIDPNLTGFESYGDISLIGDKNLIEGQKTHLADAYSPRFPSVHTTLRWDDYKQLQNDLQPFYDEIDQLGTESRKLQHEDINMLGNIENSPAVALKFLKENGVTPSKEGQFYYHGQIRKLGLDNKYQDFLDELYKKYNLKEQMFAGYTNAGKRRYKPVSVEEASKIMGKQKEEGFNYGLGSYRSKIAPIKTSAPAIRKEAGRLVTKEEFEVVEEAYDKELWDLKDELSHYAKVNDSNSFIESDAQTDAIGNVLTGEDKNLAWFKTKFPVAPDKLVQKVFAFREKLKKMPTEYFETKFRRPVDIGEFKMAVVPEDITPEARAILEKKGLRIITYAKGEKQNVIKSLLKEDVAFKRGDKADYTTTLEELRAEMKRITGQDIPLFTVENFGSEARLGEMVKGIIRILQKGNKVSDFVGKHELWHLIKRGMVTAEERNTIEAMETDLAKASPAKAQDLKDAGYTDEQVAEELMADEFARYYRTGNTFTEKIRVIFDKILQRLELLLANKSEVLTYFKTVRSKLTGEIKSNIKSAEFKDDTPQVDETAIQKTAQDIEDAFAEVSSMLEISDYGQGGQLKEDIEGNKSRQKGIWPAFMPEDMHSKADVALAGELLSGKEAKTDRQKKLYQSILKFVSDKVGADRFTDYEYAQLLQRMSDEATAERKVFIDKLVADLKKNRRALTPAETREAIKKTTEQEKSPVIQKRESTLLKDRIRTLARGYREGAKLGKDGVYETQSELIDLIEESGMTKEDRAGFIRTIRNVQTDEQLQKALPELQERIDRVVSETEKKQIRKEIIKIVKRVGDSPTVALEYKQRIKELISAFELKGHSKDTIEKLQKARAFLTEQASQGKDVEIPTRLLSNLEILNRTPFDAIPVDTLRSVLEDIKFLEKLGRTKFRVKQEVYQYEKDNILQEIKDGSQPLEKAEVAIPKPGERLSKSQKFKNYINSVINQFARIDKVISPMDVVLDTLDGAPGTYDGANYRNIKLRFDRDFNAYLQQKYQIQDPVHALADKNNFDERNYTRIGLVAAREQSGGAEKLLNNGYTQEEIDAVELTPQERELLELMKVQMDSQFPMIQQVQKDVYNLDVKKVDNYFSFMTDWALMDEAEVYLRMGPDVAEFGKNFQDVGDRVKSNIDPSFVKKRAGAGRQKIDINAMVVFMKHTDNTAYFLNFARDTKMMGEIVRGEEYREAVGDLGQLLMLEYVDLMSRQGGASGANQIAMLDWMRKNVSAGILGLKLSTIAIQWTAVIDGMGFIGPVYGSRGINSFVTDKELRNMVLSFPEMRERVGGETALEELKNSDSWLADIQKKGFIPLQKVDMVAAGSVTLGAYMQKMDAMGKQIDPNNINKEAMEYAQLALRRTQSSSLFKDVPMAISRGSMTGNRSWDRAIFQFQTFLLTRWSRVRHDAIRVGITNKDPKQAINVLFWIMLSSVAATGTRMAVKGLTDMILDAEPPEEDEDKMPYWQSSLIREMAGTVPFMGNLIGSYMYDSAFMPILDTPQNAMEGAKKMFEGVQPQTKARGFIEFSTSIGAMFGVPGSIQAQQVLKGIVEPADTKKTDREKILDKYKNGSTKTDREKILEKYR